MIGRFLRWLQPTVDSLNDQERIALSYLNDHPRSTARELIAAGVLPKGSGYVRLARLIDKGLVASVVPERRPRYEVTPLARRLLGS